MLSLRTIYQINPDFLALEANAEQAGRALACSYSSSDEFEAALIAERREAGNYGRPRWQRQLLAGVVLSAALVAVTFLFI
jgi:hypothetical protein